ncbi:MAG: cache domain-containing protein [Candidatus Riflebacteria bacterium]|nr:cache domain-containing protein [Candidatus Riflebacteria bacterium]
MNPKGDPTRIIYLFTGLIIVLICYLSWESITREKDEKLQASGQELSVLVDLAADGIIRSLNSVRDSLHLISKMPTLREYSFSGKFTPALNKVASSCSELFETLLDESVIWERTIDEKADEYLYYLEYSEAFVRRALFSLGAAIPDPSENPMLINFSRATPPLNKLCQATQQISSLFFSSLEAPFCLLDTIFKLGFPEPSNLRMAEGLLRVSLSDRNLIKHIGIQTLEGNEIVSVSQISRTPFFLNGWVRKAASASRPFFSGPVWFNEGLGRPVWQAAVPLYDLSRKPFALLSAIVDLAFLHELSARSQISSAAQLLIVDEEGVVIGHPKLAKIVLQLNLSHSGKAFENVVSGKDGIEEVNLGGGSFLAAYRNLTNYDDSSLPGWGILYLKPYSEIMSSVWLYAFNTCMIAAITIYILLQLVGMIIAGIEEDEES